MNPQEPAKRQVIQQTEPICLIQRLHKKITNDSSINNLRFFNSLLEGRFRHIRVDRQEYLLSLMMYIHLNPVAARLTSRPEAWEFSDCSDWIRISDRPTPRVAKYRSKFGLPGSDEYREMLADVEHARREAKEFERYLLDLDGL